MTTVASRDKPLPVIYDQHGSQSVKQYIPSKRSRFGIKSFVLCDSQTGCIQDLIVYCGANMVISEDVPSTSIGKSGQIVMTLLEPYLGKGHTLVTELVQQSEFVLTVT